MQRHETDVCIVGAGPAGMLAGLLLAKSGVRVLVLEHHKDFEREYRGEVLMPRFIQMFRQIGLFDFIEKYHHLKLYELEGFYKDRRILRIGFDEIAPEAPFAIWMPQPILLGALHDKARLYPDFNLWFDARVEDLVFEGSVCRGVILEREGEKTEVRAKVTVGADGRFSVVRRRGGFELADEDHQFDVIWFTLPKPAGYDNHVRFFFSPASNYLILPKYPESVQCGLLVEKGRFSYFVKSGIDSIRKVLLDSHPLMHPFAHKLRDFSPFNVLQAKIEYVKEWARDGVVLAGDSAHTCSPAGAIGVSVAAATAIVAADVIDDCLQKGDVTAEALGRIQSLRAREVRHILSMQKLFSRTLLPRSSWMRALEPVFLALLSKLGLFRRLQRDLLVMHEPLPVKKDLSF